MKKLLTTTILLLMINITYASNLSIKTPKIVENDKEESKLFGAGRITLGKY
jgi:hypothetical protein